MRRYRNQSGRKVSPARLARARRGGVAMGMMAASGRRSAFRGQTGDGVGGCMVDFAINFNADATYEDGSCIFDDGVYPIYLTSPSPYDGGCPDPNANNYDANSDYNNGSCDYSGTLGGGVQLGGTGDLGLLMCYLQSDFGTYGDFEPPFSPYSGCTDSRADNFNPDACYENMSCTFSGPYADVYSQEYYMSTSPCQFVCSTTSGGSTSGGGITDSGLTSTKDPRGKQGRKFRGATGGRFTSHWGGLRMR